MASSDTAAAARADQRLRAVLAAAAPPTIPTTDTGTVPPQGGPTQPTTLTSNVGTVPPQGGPTQPTTLTSDVGTVPPQGGPTQPTTNVGALLPPGGQAPLTDRAGVSSSVARASLLALYHFYDPPKVHSARVLPEQDLPQALARALVDYGASTRTTWLLEDD